MTTDQQLKMYEKALRENSRDEPFTKYSHRCNYCGRMLKLKDGPHRKCPVCKKAGFLKEVI